MLPIWRPGCEFCGTLEYYLPEFHEVAIAQADLKDIFTGMVFPVLREMFAPKSKTEANTEKPGAPAPAQPATAKPTARNSCIYVRKAGKKLTPERRKIFRRMQQVGWVDHHQTENRKAVS